MNHRQKVASLALAAAINFFISQGKRVFVPIGDSGKYDLLISDDSDKIERIQVKYTSRCTKQSFMVGTCTYNPKTRCKTKYTLQDFDWLFVLRSDGQQHLIPINVVANKETYSCFQDWKI